MTSDSRELLAKNWIAFHTLPEASVEAHPFRLAEYELSQMASSDHESCIAVIAEIFRRDQSARVIRNLAAGPLEDVLLEHGLSAATCFEHEMKRTPGLRLLLGGVWADDFAADVKEWLARNRNSTW